MTGLPIIRGVSVLNNLLRKVFSLFFATLSCCAYSTECPTNILTLLNVDEANISCEKYARGKDHILWVVEVIDYEDGSIFLGKHSKGKILLSKALLGEAIVLPDKNRVAVFGISSHFSVRETSIFDFDLKLIDKQKHGELIGYGSTSDQELFWYVASHIKDGCICNELVVFDMNGLIIHRFVHDKKEEVDFDFKSKSYKLVVPFPELPG